MAEYYNSGSRTPRGNDRSARDSRYTRDTGNAGYGNRRYPAFEEGYTSADNRSRQPQQQNTGSRRTARDNSGYDGRFIDAGDRYMRGFEEQAAEQPQDSRYQAQSSGRYADNGGYAPTDRYAGNDGYSYGFDDDFDEQPQDSRYQAQSTGRYADNGGYAPADRFAGSGGYARNDSQHGRAGGYRSDEYYDRRTAQNARQAGSREYYEHEEYEAPRRRSADNSRQRYEQGYDMSDLAEDNRRSGTERVRTRQQEGYYRAPAGRTAKKGASDVVGGIFDWFNRLSSRQMTWMLAGAAVVLVVVILIICLVLQSDSCGSCADSGEIPVIEQGDGDEALNAGQDFYYEEPDDTTEVVSTSDGMITIDEELDTDTFVVEVTGADGTYGRTDVHRADAATLVITNQSETGFEFSLEVKTDGASGSLSGYAYFCAEREAIYEGAQGLLNFSFGSSGVTVYQVDIIEAFAGMTPDGVYVVGTPSYVEDAAAEAEQLGLDANIRTSENVQNALAGLLSENDSALMVFIFENGTERVFEGAEKGYDKNGTAINIDAELNAVKYYAFIEGTGEEIVLICTNDAKVYIGICDGAQYRYYTNDAAYAETAPKAISGQAKGRGMELAYQQ